MNIYNINKYIKEKTEAEIKIIFSILWSTLNNMIKEIFRWFLTCVLILNYCHERKHDVSG